MEQTVELFPVVQYFTEIVLAVLAAVAVWVGTKFREKLRVDEESRLNHVINEAINAALGFAAVKFEEQGKRLTYSTKNEFKATAAQYVVKGVPKALTYFGLTVERVEEMIESRLAGRVQKDPEGE